MTNLWYLSVAIKMRRNKEMKLLPVGRTAAAPRYTQNQSIFNTYAITSEEVSENWSKRN